MPRTLLPIAASLVLFGCASTVAPVQSPDDAYDSLAATMTSDAMLGGMGEGLAVVFTPILTPMLIQAGVTDAGAQERFTTMFIEEIVTAMKPELYDMQRTVLTKHLSPETAIASAAFFETAAGREYLNATGPMMTEGARAGQEITAELLPTIIAGIQDRLRTEGEAIIGDAEAAERLAHNMSMMR